MCCADERVYLHCGWALGLIPNLSIRASRFHGPVAWLLGLGWPLLD